MNTRTANYKDSIGWMLLGATFLATIQINLGSEQIGLQVVDNKTQWSHIEELVGKKALSRAKDKYVESAQDTSQFILFKVKSLVAGENPKQELAIANAIIEEANRYGFDPVFLMAVIKQESGFKIDTIGRFGEIGLMQLKPNTAKWVAEKMKVKLNGPIDLKNPVTNIQLGTAYFAMLRQKLAHPQLYISAYNMGPLNVRRNLNKNVRPKEYASGVMGKYQGLYSEIKTAYSLAVANEVIAAQ